MRGSIRRYQTVLDSFFSSSLSSLSAHISGRKKVERNGVRQLNCVHTVAKHLTLSNNKRLCTCNIKWESSLYQFFWSEIQSLKNASRTKTTNSSFHTFESNWTADNLFSPLKSTGTCLCTVLHRYHAHSFFAKILHFKMRRVSWAFKRWKDYARLLCIALEIEIYITLKHKVFGMCVAVCVRIIQRKMQWMMVETFVLGCTMQQQ